MTIEQFCNKHGIHPVWLGVDGVERVTPMEEVWATCPPSVLMRIAALSGVLDEPTKRRFGAFVVDQVGPHLSHPRSLVAAEVVKMFAYGETTKEVLELAYADADKAACLLACECEEEEEEEERGVSAAEVKARAAWAVANAAWPRDADGCFYAAKDSRQICGAAAAAQAAWLRENAAPVW